MLLTPVQAIKKFFDTPDRPVTMAEMKALSPEDRMSLAKDCAKALGAERQVVAAA